MDLKEEVKKVIAETVEVERDELVEGKKLYDSIGVDSTEMVETAVALSKHFGINLKANEISKDSTPEDIIEVVAKKQAEKDSL